MTLLVKHAFLLFKLELNTITHKVQSFAGFAGYVSWQRSVELILCSIVLPYFFVSYLSKIFTIVLNLNKQNKKWYSTN